MNRGLWLAAGVVGLWLLAAAFGPVFVDDPNAIVLEAILEPPSTAAIVGRDELGRPVFERVVMGARTAAVVGAGVVAVAAVVGVALGALAGFAGGTLDRFVGFVVDVVLAFPGLLLAIALAAVLGPGLENVILALAAVGWVGFARLTRAQVLVLREREHVSAARALGTTPVRIVLRHLLPLAAAPLIVEASFAMATATLAEAGMAFLGLGVQPPDASWGVMIRDGARFMLVAPHLVIAPGLALFAVVLAINLLGDALRDRLDVRLR
ncbi:MAG: ABC transporter permease [Chromatiales bacterium]|nr:ABC transporter permease [Chromatiales bacterium]